MVKMYTRKTKEELLQEAKDRVKKIEAEIQAASKKKTVKLTKNSEGIAEAIDAITKAAEANKSTLAEVIKAIASIKRTGLRIENAVSKSADYLSL